MAGMNNQRNFTYDSNSLGKSACKLAQVVGGSVDRIIPMMAYRKVAGGWLEGQDMQVRLSESQLISMSAIIQSQAVQPRQQCMSM